MEATMKTFTAQDWTEHEQFVQMFRAAKQRKREWQAKMEVTLAEKAQKIRKRREDSYHGDTHHRGVLPLQS